MISFEFRKIFWTPFLYKTLFLIKLVCFVFGTYLKPLSGLSGKTEDYRLPIDVLKISSSEKFQKTNGKKDSVNVVFK